MPGWRFFQGFVLISCWAGQLRGLEQLFNDGQDNFPLAFSKLRDMKRNILKFDKLTSCFSMKYAAINS